MPPFVQVVTDVATGITQSVEFYFGDDSAWKTAVAWEWGDNHPFLSQCRRLKIELEEPVNQTSTGTGSTDAFIPPIELSKIGFIFLILLICVPVFVLLGIITVKLARKLKNKIW